MKAKGVSKKVNRFVAFSSRIVVPILHGLLLVTLTLISGASFAQAYQLIMKPGISWAINDAGQIVGQSSLNGDYSAVLWNAGVATDLGVPFVEAGYLPVSTARSINNVGQVVGTSGGYATLWSNGRAVQLSDQAGSVASGINSTGQIVGSVNGNAVLWNESASGVVTLNNSGGVSSQATDINDQGQIVGNITRLIYGQQQATQAVIWNAGVATVVNDDINSYSTAVAVNNRGDVIGEWKPEGPASFGGVLWRNGQQFGLTPNAPGFSSGVSDINDSGFIVGSINNRAYVWTDDLNRYDLNNLIDTDAAGGVTLNSATGINNLGDIVGFATKDGVQESYLLIPVGPIPEPSTYCLMLFGLATVVAFSRRRCPLWPSRFRTNK